MTSVNTFLSRLSSWKQSTISSHLCLDLRPSAAYQTRQLVPSTNIPWQQLSSRCAELPPKNVPFALVQPAGQPEECSTWLQEHGWQCPWVFQEEELYEENNEEWQRAQERGWVGNTPPQKQWLLFQPCPFLAKHMATIESQLARRGDDTWHCLDIGCGSGRDVAWILSHSPRWRVSAYDSLKGAVDRTFKLAENMNVADRLNVTQAKVMADGAWKTFDEETEKRVLLQEQTKKERFAPGIPASQFLGEAKYDLVLTIRFLVRPLLLYLPSLLNKGGFLVISHFVDDGVHEYSQPRKDHRLQLHELRQLYGGMEDVEILVDTIEEIEDGRPVNSFILKKL